MPAPLTTARKSFAVTALGLATMVWAAANIGIGLNCMQAAASASADTSTDAGDIRAAAHDSPARLQQAAAEVQGSIPVPRSVAAHAGAIGFACVLQGSAGCIVGCLVLLRRRAGRGLALFLAMLAIGWALATLATVHTESARHPDPLEMLLVFAILQAGYGLLAIGVLWKRRAEFGCAPGSAVSGED